MKHKILFFALALASGYGMAFADGGSSDDDTSESTIIVRGKPGNMPPPDRPRMPSYQTILVSYDRESETCEFSLPASVDYLYVTFEGTQTGYIYSTDVSSENTSVSVALPADYYTITCLSDEGATFYGEGYIN